MKLGEYMKFRQKTHSEAIPNIYRSNSEYI